MKLNNILPIIFVFILVISAFLIVRFSDVEQQPIEEPQEETLDEEINEVVIGQEEEPSVEEEQATIGNRLTGEVKEVEIDPALIDHDMIVIYKNKTYSKDFIMIWVGGNLTFINTDDAPHLVVVDKDKQRYFVGDRFEPGQTYTKVFEEPGDYFVHDMFAGTARLTLVVSEKN